MPTQLALLKGLASAGGGIAIGGGSYVVYQNTDTIKNFFVADKKDATNAVPTEEEQKATYNLFLVRYKSEKTSDQTLTTDGNITCTIGTEAPVACKIYKFTTTKKDNIITSTEIAALKPVTTPNSDFVDNSYFVIELTSTTKTFADLKNKEIAFKKEQTLLGNFTFDQVIVGQTIQTAAPLAAAEDTYLVKKTQSWTISTAPNSYRCKLAAPTSSDNTKVDNYDSSCKLVKITADSTDTVTTFTHLQGLTTKITPDNLHNDSDTYYKLIVNKNLLYNLAFDANVTTSVEVEVIKEDDTSVGKLEILQKFDTGKFIGKTDLVLAKVKENTSTLSGVLTGGKCSLTKDAVVNDANQIDCTLYTTTKATSNPTEKNLTFSETAPTAEDKYAIGDYYVIKLTTPKDIADFDNKTAIYYKIPDTSVASGTEAKHKNIEFDVVALMSGSITSGKKPIFIKEAQKS